MTRLEESNIETTDVVTLGERTEVGRCAWDTGITTFTIKSSEPLHFFPTMNMYVKKTSFLATSKAKKEVYKKHFFQYFHPTKTGCEH